MCLIPYLPLRLGLQLGKSSPLSWWEELRSQTSKTPKRSHPRPLPNCICPEVGVWAWHNSVTKTASALPCFCAPISNVLFRRATCPCYSDRGGWEVTQLACSALVGSEEQGRKGIWAGNKQHMSSFCLRTGNRGLERLSGLLNVLE